MNKIHNLAYAGLLVNILITLYTGFSERYNILLIPSLVSVLLYLIGIILIVTNKNKIGSILFYIGSIMFIPLGILGIIEVKKTVQNLKEEQFIKNNYE